MSSVIPASLADQIIAEKIREWELKRKREKAGKSDIEIYPFLTITRDFGCGEENILPQLQKKLKWKIYGKDLLDRLAQTESLSRGFIETLDEQKQNVVDNWVNYLIRSGAMLQDDYVVKISKMIKVIVSQESAIIVGRGANYILHDRKEGLRIKLTAPFECRVENIMKVRKLPKAKAEKLVRDIDVERMGFIDRFFNFGRKIRIKVPFDIIFNTGNLSSELICKSIIMFLDEKKNSR